MKTNATQELQSALDNCEAVEAALVKEAKFIRDSLDELHAFQKTVDLSDFAQRQRMTCLLTISQVANVRRGHRHQEKGIALAALVAENAQFAKTALHPRCQQLEARVRAKVSDKLKKLFPDENARQSAVLHSPEFLALAPILERTIVSDYTPEGAILQSKIILGAWANADEFEQNHLI
jgi:hypothetical protein